MERRKKKRHCNSTHVCTKVSAFWLVSNLYSTMHAGRPAGGGGNTTTTICHNRPCLVLLLIDTPLVGFGSGPYDRAICGRAAVVILDADRVVRVLGHNCASLSTWPCTP